MKKIIAMICSLFLSFQLIYAQRDVVTRDVNKLPAAAREFVKTQFPNSQISYLKVDKSLFSSTSYDVKLSNGVDLEFDNNGEWIEIDCENLRSIPMSVLPDSIRNYMKKEYPKHRVVKVERKHKGYELTLENDLEVDFDKYGNFLKLSD